MLRQTAIWLICSLSILGMLTKPRKIEEWKWSVCGATILTLSGLVVPSKSYEAVCRGLDVYLFLIGMMLLAEIARFEGVFDWIARIAVSTARGSRMRLFWLLYAVGCIVTIILSNDATAVVLTPAVAAAMRTVEVDPLPYVYACAFIANAASFVLPVSNPANLVIFGKAIPNLSQWIHLFIVPSILAILATACSIILLWRNKLQGPLQYAPSLALKNSPMLTKGGKMALLGIGVTAVTLLLASSYGASLGLATCICGIVTCMSAIIRDPHLAKPIFRSVSWSVLLLVAGLFVLMEGLSTTGLLTWISHGISILLTKSHVFAHLTIAAVTAILANLINNLPAGLIAGISTMPLQGHQDIKAAIAISIDLSPNASVTGSLATILWLIALRREGIEVSAWSFLKVGAIVMPPALFLAIVALGW